MSITFRSPYSYSESILDLAWFEDIIPWDFIFSIGSNDRTIPNRRRAII